jgi:hypothetical protein
MFVRCLTIDDALKKETPSSSCVAQAATILQNDVVASGAPSSPPAVYRCTYVGTTDLSRPELSWVVALDHSSVIPSSHQAIHQPKHSGDQRRRPPLPASPATGTGCKDARAKQPTANLLFSQSTMALPYPNPSLSEMAEESSRDGSVRGSETQSQTKHQHPTSKMAARQIILTIMYEIFFLFIPHLDGTAPPAHSQ